MTGTIFSSHAKHRPRWFCPRPLVEPQKVSSSFSHLKDHVTRTVGSSLTRIGQLKTYPWHLSSTTFLHVWQSVPLVTHYQNIQPIFSRMTKPNKVNQQLMNYNNLCTETITFSTCGGGTSTCESPDFKRYDHGHRVVMGLWGGSVEFYEEASTRAHQITISGILQLLAVLLPSRTALTCSNHEGTFRALSEQWCLRRCCHPTFPPLASHRSKDGGITWVLRSGKF